MKKKLLLLLLLLSITLFSQKIKSSKMGQTTLDELEMTVYDKDSAASAVVLYEHGNTYILPSTVHDFRKDYYIRIKVLNKKAFNKLDFKMVYSNYDLVHNIEGITYNLDNNKIVKTRLNKKNIFISKFSENRKSVTFSLPNVKEGSIIEYKLSFSSNSYKIYNWTFQSDIPKKTSLSTSEVSGSTRFNLRLAGFLSLDKEEVTLKNKCKGIYTCSNLYYQINNIPAFVAESYLSSSTNFISKIIFENEYSDAFTKKKYLNSWKYLDERLKSIYVFGKQLKKRHFFKQKMDPIWLMEKDTLQKAKKIYYWLQEHYTWNCKLNLFFNNDLKKAFKNKSANNSAINFSLFNALKAANLDAEIAILSTRDNGFVTKLHPAITEFNYLIVVVRVNGKDYFLDASDKFLKFGQPSFKALNGDVRVLDFEKNSYWKSINNETKTSKNIQITLALNSINLLEGDLIITSKGYEASNTKRKISLYKNTEIITDLEAKNNDLEIMDYTVDSLNFNEKPLVEKFRVNMTIAENSDKIVRINPFFFDRIRENPFKLKERKYPVDFGYSRKNNYYLNLEIPLNYKIVKLPENKVISLPNNGGRFIIRAETKGNIIRVYLRLNIAKSTYSVAEYYALKDFYNQIIKSESEYIILEKK